MLNQANKRDIKMNNLIAQPKTIKLALEAARNNKDARGRPNVQSKYIEIIERVRDTGMPDMAIIAKYKS